MRGSFGFWLTLTVIAALLLSACADRPREAQALQPCGAALFCVPI